MYRDSITATEEIGRAPEAMGPIAPLRKRNHPKELLTVLHRHAGSYLPPLFPGEGEVSRLTMHNAYKWDKFSL